MLPKQQPGQYLSGQEMTSLSAFTLPCDQELSLSTSIPEMLLHYCLQHPVLEDAGSSLTVECPAAKAAASSPPACCARVVWHVLRPTAPAASLANPCMLPTLGTKSTNTSLPNRPLPVPVELQSVTGCPFQLQGVDIPRYTASQAVAHPICCPG